ncbi:MAG: potassium channel family protein [Chloroflexota bacterium]
MPVFGFFALARLFGRVANALWHKEEIRGFLWMTLAIIFLGTWFYYQFEPSITTWGDAYYFTIITLTSIGYGDFSPTIPLTRIFTTVYVFVGIGIIAGFIGLIGTTLIEDAKQRHAAERDAQDAVS